MWGEKATGGIGSHPHIDAAILMKTALMKCWHCGRAIEVIERVGFRDECAGCGRPLHVCRNCGFYDPAYNNACREPMAERVVDKDRFNFCEYFAPGTGQGAAVATASHSKSAAQAKLDALFKKKS
jgi:hypothetical protein